MKLPLANEASIVRTAVSNLEERFANIEHDRTASTVERRVQERYANARITTFVGIIAERDARAELERELVQREDSSKSAASSR